MTISREEFNECFNTNIAAKNWEENASLVCNEFDSLNELFQSKIYKESDNQTILNSTIYHVKLDKYIFFNKENYDLEKNIIVGKGK